MSLVLAKYAETLSSSTAYPRSSSSADNNPSSSAMGSKPSLILAFLALGFFTMTLGFVIGFRRYQYTHQSRSVSPSDEEIRTRMLMSRKPRLWDVLTDTSATDDVQWGCAAAPRNQGDHWRWENIMVSTYWCSGSTNTSLVKGNVSEFLSLYQRQKS